MSSSANGQSIGQRGMSVLEVVARELLLAVRHIMQRPGFTLVVVLTLAVGIGPNVAIFSVLKALVLKPLPYPEPDRLVQVWESDIEARWGKPFSYPDFLDVRDQSRCFAAFGVFTPRSYNLGGGEAVQVTGAMGTAGALRAYGIEPALGRFFTRAEMESESRLVILSNQLWQDRYQTDPDIVGSTVVIDGEGFEVIGVMPAAAEYLTPWSRGRSIQLWTPLQVPPEAATAAGRGRHWLLGIGRLAPGISCQAAEAELKSISASLAERYPDTNARTTTWLNPFLSQVVGHISGQLVVLLGAVGLVLLIACANVASMLLAQGTGRQKEVAIRASLGASKGRIAAQQLVESLLLAALGCAAGVLLAQWSITFLRGIVPPDVPRADGIVIDNGVLLFALVLVPVVSLVFGLVPALTASRTNIMANIREGSGTVTSSTARNRMLRRLAVAQLAVAFTLTNGAVLLLKSYQNVLETPQVFDTDQVLTMSIALKGGEYETDQGLTDAWERILERISGLPGVEQAAVSTKLPLEGGSNGSILVEGEVFDPGRRSQLVERSYVSPDYFKAMGIPLVSGRLLQESDWHAESTAVVVNRALVEHYWPDKNPIGQRIRQDTEQPEWTVEVVGVVENVRQWGAEYRPLPEMYRPFPINPFEDAKLIVRGRGDVLSLVPAIRAQLLELDPNQPIANIRTMGQVLAGATRGRQFLLLMVSLFAVMALLLSITGVFGIMSHTVAQRRREIGVRMAFGAAWKNLIAMVLGQVLRLAVYGTVAGALLFLLLGGVVRSELYGVGDFAILYLLGGAFIMLTTALLAAAVPALRATRVDPNSILRND